MNQSSQTNEPNTNTRQHPKEGIASRLITFFVIGFTLSTMSSQAKLFPNFSTTGRLGLTVLLAGVGAGAFCMLFRLPPINRILTAYDQAQAAHSVRLRRSLWTIFSVSITVIFGGALIYISIYPRIPSATIILLKLIIIAPTIFFTLTALELLVYYHQDPENQGE